MIHKQTRRHFLKTTAVAGAVVGTTPLPDRLASAGTEEKSFSKAVIVPPPDEKKLKEIRDAGFDGVEASLSGKLVDPKEAARIKGIADSLGVRVHTVLRGWANFNDPEKAQEDFDYTVATIQAAHSYGSDAILLVPGRVGGMPLPEKWGFTAEFDEKTGHLTQVGDGDSEYDEYKRAHNQAWDAFQEWVPKLIPIAKETGVVVAIENVWSNLFNTPEHYKHFIESFDSPWVRAYYDVANHMAYGRPAEEWIRILGDLIVKVHIKDYQVKPAEGQNEWPNLREGSVNFPEVVKALHEVGYTGWLTIEGSGGLPYPEQFKRLQTIIAGG